MLLAKAESSNKAKAIARIERKNGFAQTPTVRTPGLDPAGAGAALVRLAQQHANDKWSTHINDRAHQVSLPRVLDRLNLMPNKDCAAKAKNMKTASHYPCDIFSSWSSESRIFIYEELNEECLSTALLTMIRKINLWDTCGPNPYSCADLFF